MIDEKPVSEAELKAEVYAAILKHEVKYGVGYVNLGGYEFDRVPATRRRIYAVARKYAAEWGYEYQKAEYHPSGNPAFKRNHKRGRYDAPGLYRRGRSS